MDRDLESRLAGLHADGVGYDAGRSDRLSRRRNLEPDTAALLSMVVRIAAARHVVEIGTSNGYSTIWLADAVRDLGGHVVSVDTLQWPGVRENLSGAGVAGIVELRIGDGGKYLTDLPDGSVDLLFLDAERVEYPGWWPHPIRVLRPGGVLAVDNVLSHPDEVAEFLALVAADDRCTMTTVAVGKGLTLAWRRPDTHHDRTGPFWDAIAGRTPAPPAARTLGWQLQDVDPAAGTVRVSFEARPDFANPTGAIQGGFLAAMLDDTMGPALVATLDPDQFAPTLELKVSFLRPARPGRLVGTARVVHCGSSIAFLSGELTDASGEVVATASATARIVRTTAEAP